jgi:hypothetical protein
MSKYVLGNPLWNTISQQNLVESGGLYTDYIPVPLSNPVATGSAQTLRSGKIVGAWYLHQFYYNMYNAWNYALGSGITVTLQEPFDYTHITYYMVTTGYTGGGWNIDDYKDVYTLITGGSISAFSIVTTGGQPLNRRGILGTCYWYSGGAAYACSGGTGCLLAYNSGDPTKVPNLTLAINNPRTCYNTNFNPSTGLCRDGRWRDEWLTSGIPTAFTPFGHGDVVTSIIANRERPINDIDASYEAIGTMGVAPRCTILIGSNANLFDQNELSYNIDVRVNTFDQPIDETDAQLMVSSGVILVQSTYTNYNYDYVQVTGLDIPEHCVHIGSARWLGNDYVIYTGLSYSESAETNYGAYSGYGKHKYIDFAAPSVNVWANNPRFNVDPWGMWGGAYDGASMATAFGAGILALTKSVHTGLSPLTINNIVCYSSKKLPVRQVPADLPHCGMGQLAYDISASDTDIYIENTQYGSGTVNWYYAYESGNSFNASHQPYSLIQFGTDPSDPEYEIVFYTGKQTTGYTTKDKNTPYATGSFTGCIRGFMGTIPKSHNAGSKIYTPLITYSGWDKFIGWGIPDVTQCIKGDISKARPLPPKNVTCTYGGTRNVLVIKPYRSSLCNGFVVVKNTRWYPRSVNDGEIVYTYLTTSGDLPTVVTGYDYSVASGYNYYTVFSRSRHSSPIYSDAADYATCSVYIASSVTDAIYASGAKGIVVKTDYLVFTPGYEYKHYRYYLSMAGDFSTIIATGIKAQNMHMFYDITSGGTYYYKCEVWPNSANQLYNSDFMLFSGSNIEYWTTGSELPDGTWHVAPYPDGYFDPWSLAFTTSGDYSSLESGVYIQYTQYIPASGTTYTLSLYAKLLSNGSNSVYAKLLCYSGLGTGYIGMLDSQTREQTVSGTWRQYSFDFDLATSGFIGTQYIVPRIYGTYAPSGIYQTCIIDNIQLATGTNTDYSAYYANQPIYTITGSIIVS